VLIFVEEIPQFPGRNHHSVTDRSGCFDP